MKIIIVAVILFELFVIGYLIRSIVRTAKETRRKDKLIYEMDYCPSCCVSSPCRCAEATKELQEMEAWNERQEG